MNTTDSRNSNQEEVGGKLSRAAHGTPPPRVSAALREPNPQGMESCGIFSATAVAKAFRCRVCRGRPTLWRPIRRRWRDVT